MAFAQEDIGGEQTALPHKIPQGKKIWDFVSPQEKMARDSNLIL
jgi:hypothetical protein